VLNYVQEKYNIIPMYVYVWEKTESVTVFILREGPGFLLPEKRVLILIFGAVLKSGRVSASNCDSVFS